VQSNSGRYRGINIILQTNKANLSPFLMSLSICNKGKINNAGALMFASKVEKFVPHAESIFASFKGTDKTNIYDRNDVRDDLLIQFGEAVAFFKKHLNVRSEIRGFDRFDIYEIPLDALREAVVNAIVHRDYAIKGTSIYVRIYDDRVEIENPGGLPDGITRRDFGKSSVRRNPIIADLFHRMGKVERMGSGIERMRELMRDAGLKEPVFEMDAFFRVTFYRNPRNSLKADRFQKAGKKDGETGEKTRGITGEKTREKILQALKANPEITMERLAEIIGITSKGIEWQIKRLKEEGFIKRIGPAKGGYWEIVNG
jgi:ATP-dependent DNA helicase RecG